MAGFKDTVVAMLWILERPGHDTKHALISSLIALFLQRYTKKQVSCHIYTTGDLRLLMTDSNPDLNPFHYAPKAAS